MSDKNDKSNSPAPSDSALVAILRNRYLTWTIVTIATLILIVLTIITILAFAQGRKVSIFGFEIEARPTSQADSLFPTLTPLSPNSAGQIDSDLVSIEDFPGELLSFSGNGGYGQFNVIRKENSDLDYLFYYDMPQGGDGYAGIFFRFTPTRDLTEFISLQITTSFSDDEAICQVYLEDQDGKQSYISLGKSRLDNVSDDARMVIEGDDRIFTIPLADNFLNVSNKQSIAGIGISINASHIEGSHSCTIQEIYLLK